MQLHPGRMSRGEANIILVLAASPFWLPIVFLVTDWLGFTNILGG